MISSLYFIVIGVWLTIGVMGHNWWIVAAMVMLGVIGVKHLSPRKLSKDSSNNLTKLALLFSYLDSSYLIGDPRVKKYLLRLISELAVNTCKDRQVSYATLEGKWIQALSIARKEVESHGNQPEDR